MPRRVKHIEPAFTAGEIDPQLIARLDIEQYFRGADKLRNVQISAQGALRRRPGEVFIDDQTAPGVSDTLKMVPFSFTEGTTTHYLLAFTHNEMKVYRQTGVPPNTTETLTATVVTTIQGGHLDEATFAQDQNTLVVFSRFLLPQIINRTSDVAWTVGDIPLRTIPQANFPDTAGPSVDHVEELRFNNMLGGDRFTLFVNGSETEPISWDVVAATTAANIAAAIEALPNVSTSNVAVVSIGVGRFSVTFQTDNSGKEWAIGQGDMNFDAGFPSGKEVRTHTVTRGSPPKEDIWSVARGFPRCGAFFNGRLYMAGSSQKQLRVWGSRSLDAEDFVTVDDPQDDSPLESNLTADEGGEIVQLFAGRHLLAFTSRAEYYVPGSDTDVITNTNFFFRRTAGFGARVGLQVFDVGGATVYLQAQDKALRELIFTDGEQAYQSNDLSTLAPHLLQQNSKDVSGLGRSPRIAYQRASNTRDPDYIYVVQQDGTIAVLALNRRENVAGWSLWSTEDFDSVFNGWHDVAVLNDVVYAACYRGGLGNSIEKFNPLVWLDMAERVVSGLPDSETSVQSQLIPSAGSVTVSTVVDDHVDNSEVFTSGEDGIIEFSGDAETEWQAGIQFPVVTGMDRRVWIKTLPFEDEALGIPLLGEPKSIAEVVLRLFETRHLHAGGEEISFRQFGDPFDAPPTLFTGDKRVVGIVGWDTFAQLEITQSQPLPFNLLGLAMKVCI